LTNLFLDWSKKPCELDKSFFGPARPGGPCLSCPRLLPRWLVPGIACLLIGLVRQHPNHCGDENDCGDDSDQEEYF
jgi:hypothetical protein